MPLTHDPISTEAPSARLLLTYITEIKDVLVDKNEKLVDIFQTEKSLTWTEYNIMNTNKTVRNYGSVIQEIKDNIDLVILNVGGYKIALSELLNSGNGSFNRTNITSLRGWALDIDELRETVSFPDIKITKQDATCVNRYYSGGWVKIDISLNDLGGAITDIKYNLDYIGGSLNRFQAGRENPYITWMGVWGNMINQNLVDDPNGSWLWNWAWTGDGCDGGWSETYPYCQNASFTHTLTQLKLEMIAQTLILPTEPDDATACCLGSEGLTLYPYNKDYWQGWQQGEHEGDHPSKVQYKYKGITHNLNIKDTIGIRARSEIN